MATWKKVLYHETDTIDHPSLLASNVVGSDEIDANAVGASELNVSGNGTTSQYLRSDGDGSFTWATPPDTDTNTTYTASTGLYLGSGAFSLKHLGLEALSDPNADRVMMWDDSAGALKWMTFTGTGVNISGTTATFTNTDTNTTYSAGSGLSLSGTSFSLANDSVGPDQINGNTAGNTGNYLQLQGGGTGLGWGTPTNTTYSAGSGLSLSGTTFSIGTLPNGSVSGEIIGDESITQGKLQDDSVQENNIEDNSISLAKMKDNSVRVAELDTSTSPSSGQFLQYAPTSTGLHWTTVTRDSLNTGKHDWGHHGHSTRIKILPTDFMQDSDSTIYNYAITSADSGGSGRLMHSSLEVFGNFIIPQGMKATAVMIYCNQNRGIQTYQCYISSSTATSLGTGTCNTQDTLSSQVTASDTNYLSIRVDLADTSDRLYGGYIVIAEV